MPSQKRSQELTLRALFYFSKKLVRDSIKTGMLPTIDSAKTLGIVFLPGMMTESNPMR